MWIGGPIFTSGATTTLSCDQGYNATIPGAVLTCQDVFGDLSFAGTGLTAVCVKGTDTTPDAGHKQNECLAPVAVAHGTWSQGPFVGFEVGTSTTLTCDQGYTAFPNSSTTMQCDSNLLWVFTGDYAQCIPAGSHH
jgi:hypothetical protein